MTTLASAASAAGTAIPGDVLRAASVATRKLRGIACEVLHGSTAASPAGNAVDGCDGPAATESPGVARLRAVLEHHGGPWSSEHHRVYAQGFLGDNARREGLRESLRLDPVNARAGCDLARALSRDDPDAAAAILGEVGDASCLGRVHVWGDTLRR